MANINYIIKGTFDSGAVDKAKKSFGDMSSSAASGALKAAGAVAGVTAAIVAATAAAVDFVAKSNESENNIIRLQQVQKNTFDNLKISMQKINEQINIMQGKTLFDDDAIMKAQAALMSIGAVTEQTFDSVMNASADLAAFLGTDLVNAANMLGKALKEPNEALGQLERAGIRYTDAEEQMIKAMIKAGDSAGAQQIILKKLNDTIGGTAEAMGSGATAGAIKLKQSLDNLKDSLGILIGSGLQGFFEFLTKIIDALNKSIEKTKELNEAVKTGQVILGGVATPAEQRIAIVQSEIKLLETNLQAVERSLITLGQKGVVTAADKAYSAALTNQQNELKNRISVLIEIVKNLQKPEEAVKYNARIEAEQKAARAAQSAQAAIEQNTRAINNQIIATEKNITELKNQREITEDTRNRTAKQRQTLGEAIPFTGSILPDMSFLSILADIFNPFMSSLANAILKIDNVAKVFNFVGTIVSGVIDIIGNLLNDALAPVVQFLTILGRTLGGILLPIINLLAPILKIISDGLLWLYNNAIRHLANGIIFVLNTIMALVAYIWNGIAGAINATLGWAGVRVGYMNVPSPTQGFLQEIVPTQQQQSTVAGGGSYGGAAASYSGIKEINVFITFAQSYVNGDARQIALMLRDEIHAAEALGY